MLALPRYSISTQKIVTFSRKIVFRSAQKVPNTRLPMLVKKCPWYWYIWLVVSTPLKNMKVSWDDSSQYMESHKGHVPVTTNQIWLYRSTIGDHPKGPNQHQPSEGTAVAGSLPRARGPYGTPWANVRPAQGMAFRTPADSADQTSPII